MRSAFHRRPTSAPPPLPLGGLGWAQVLVPFQIVCRRPNAGDVGFAVAIQIGHRAGCGGNVSIIESGPIPVLSIKRIDVHALRFTAHPRNYLIVPVAAEVRRDYGMTIQEAIIDHLALPGRTLLPIHGDLIAMPRFDGRKKAVLTCMPHCNVARSALGPRGRVAFRDFRFTPLAMLAIELVQLAAGKSRGQDFIPAVAVPLDDGRAVHYSLGA